MSGRTVPGSVTIPARTFEQLENFLLMRRGGEPDAPEVLRLSVRRGAGKLITAKNFIGVIALKDGTEIEILPKIYSKLPCGAAGVKRLVCDMLRCVYDAPYRSFQFAHIDMEKFSLYETFIRMFLDEVFVIVKRGIQSGYEAVCSNENILKGKLVFSEQIKKNAAHRERMFSQFDEFSHNRPENRLIKSTLELLCRQTSSARNKTDLKTLLNAFSGVNACDDYKSDFERCVPDRKMRDYKTVLRWCRVFLTGRSFTAFSGKEEAYALLFPMETLFESFIARKLRKVLPPDDFSLSVQNRKYHLFEQPSKHFALRPDLVVTRRADGAVFVLDTKWKLLSVDKTNYGISQADMYQMYVYGKKYAAAAVILLYPLVMDVPDDHQIGFDSSDGVSVRIRFVDLLDVTESLRRILAVDEIFLPPGLPSDAYMDCPQHV